VGVIVGVDGGNSKTELVAATTDGELIAFVRGAAATRTRREAPRAPWT